MALLELTFKGHEPITLTAAQELRLYRKLRERARRTREALISGFSQPPATCPEDWLVLFTFLRAGNFRPGCSVGLAAAIRQAGALEQEVFQRNQKRADIASRAPAGYTVLLAALQPSGSAYRWFLETGEVRRYNESRDGITLREYLYEIDCPVVKPKLSRRLEEAPPEIQALIRRNAVAAPQRESEWARGLRWAHDVFKRYPKYYYERKAKEQNATIPVPTSNL